MFTLNNFPARFQLAILLIISQISFAQTPSFKWADRIAGVNSSTPANLATDVSGNVITVGYLGLPAISDFDPGPGVYYIPTPGFQNNYISKLDANGAFVWATAIGGQGMNDIKGITTDGAGNIYLTGNFSNTADFDPGPGTFNISSNNGSMDVFVAKLDANANLLWVKTVGGIGTDQGRAVTVDLGGNVYVTGKFNGSVDFDPGIGVFSLFAYNEDAFVLKLAANGDFIWAKNMGGNQYDQGCDIVADTASNIFVSGQFSGFGIFGNYSMAALGQKDVFITKLDSSGTVLWVKQLGASLDSPRVFSMALDHTGDVVIAGQYFNKIDVNPNSGVSSISAQPYGCGNYFLLKLTAGGSFVWGMSYARPALTCQANIDIATDTGGNIYATGIFSGGSDFDPGPGTYNLVPKGVSSGISDYDIFISRINANGTFGWARGIGSIQRGDQGVAIVVDSSGNLYTTGVFTDTVDMNPGANNFFLYAPDSNAGNPDHAVYVLKWGQCPNISTVVTQSACNSYIFAGNTYTSSGTYTLLLTTSNNCDSVVTLQLTIDPDTSVTLIYYGIIKSEETGGTYQWLDCNNGMSAIPGATNAVFNPAGDGTYAVALNKNGCVDTSRCYFVYATGIDPMSEKTVLRYYPNPVQDHVIIELDRAYHEIRTELYNVAGQLIQKDLFTDRKTIKSSFNIPPGVYLMSIQADKTERQWVKLVK